MTQFKDKAGKNAERAGLGLLAYPVLMAADILLYDAEFVPVGKDQLQHLEMTRDVASRFHNQMGETFVIPQDKIQEDTMLVPGTDGNKMSKSRGNIINVFLPEKQLKKQLNGIVTDSTPLEEPKDPDTCNAFVIYKLLATEEETAQMRANYENGGWGYGHTKKAILDMILDKFAEPREKFNFYMENPAELDKVLADGAAKAKVTADNVLGRVRGKLGLL